MNPYYSTTKGYNAEVIVANRIEYSVHATYAAFVAGAAEGEIGVYNAQTKALISGAGAVAAGTEVFIAQKRDGGVHKSTPFKVVSGVGAYTAYQAPVKQVWTIDSSGMAAPVKGEVYEFAITELTKGAGKYAIWNFEETAKTGDTLTTVLNRLVAKVNNAADGANYAFGQIATAANTGSDIVLTANDFGRYFRVSLRQKFAEVTAAITTQMVYGSGTYEGVAELEAEGQIFAGVTTNFPGDGMANPEDFGKATNFATAGFTYDIAMFSPWAEEKSPMPFHKHVHQKYIVLALPATGTSPTAEIKLIFGF